MLTEVTWSNIIQSMLFSLHDNYFVKQDAWKENNGTMVSEDLEPGISSPSHFGLH